MLIESLVPLRVKLPSGEVLLEPGRPVRFSEEDAHRLLEKVPDKVRLAITIEPAHPNARPVYWQRTATIVGPGIPELLAKVGDEFWIVVQFQGQPVWVNSVMLRSKQQYETQTPLRPVEMVKDLR